MTIAIIAAMKPELDALKQHLDQRVIEKHHNISFYKGNLAEKDVVLVQSGIGKVAASIATTLIIDKYAPSAVINTGSAGGLDAGNDIGDVVIASELRHHDVDVTPFGFEYGQVFDMPAAYYSDAKLIEAAQQALAEQAELSAQIAPVVSGDSFLYQPEKVAALQQHFPKAKAVEMEGASIAQVCFSLNVPCVVIRALSDIAGKSSHMSFEQFLPLASQHSAQMVMQMLKRL